MEKRYIVDTNILLTNPEILREYNTVVTSHVLREIEHLEKTRKADNVLQWQIRGLKRFLEENNKHIFYDLKDYSFNLRDDWDKDYVDNILVQVAIENDYGMISGDRLVINKCELYNIDTINPRVHTNNQSDDNYKGFVEVEMNTEEYNDFYNNRIHNNEFNLLVNQYLIITNTDTNMQTAMKYNGEYYIDIKSKKIRSQLLGDFKPKDVYQHCVIDSLINNDITLIRGKAGTAKTLSAISYAIQQLESTKADKLIVFSNSVPTKNAQYLGMNKGSLKDKLLQVSVGHILASKLGGYMIVEELLLEEKLVILPFSDIRGYDTSGMNAVVLITEAQNLDRELIKLAIQRVGEDCKLIIEGDNKTQLDLVAFEGNNNGMSAVSEIFRGEDLYGEIELQNIYRSRIAELAEKLTSDSI